MVTLHTNYGDITLQLNAEKAPLTVANFMKYVEEGFYDNTIFHRVIDGFMIQGGGFTEDMGQKRCNETIKNEANNGLSNRVGTIAMARTSDPHSATAQFFINVNDNTFLDFKSETTQGWGYCVFGEVVEGLDIVEKIKTVATGNRGMHQNVPLEAVVLQNVSVKA
ncbi:peptidyl-prolyl cis-trans isomerase [Shewanella inventionis]|uniref:Peptidyl-prolyl cis-trans isomerase n=1 Tax=Shewanella inventionis TaxID=1738770 RepID=A0ABQ1JD21_9GAMM|nr:peptidylprolyl isomerase [Shewanella inventionis]MCL1158133.1 peptidyl-prolyl cis-trans isomerase [Shewanella inventionis]UAL42365.1 peptidyl-prolyl cis-trans isomerase [Shewanella inventionis]GGB63959.1 peptidyl-prolyl cis-trans isomerase [Shewanella inventionis]